jgi:lysozyme family protein
MTDLVAPKAANAKRWGNIELTRNFSSVSKHLVVPEAKSHYHAVAAKTGAACAVVAVIPGRESSQDWTDSLALDDPWNRHLSFVLE